MEPERDIIPIGISANKVMCLPAVIVNIDQPRRQNESLAVDPAHIGREMRWFLRNPDCCDAISLGEQGAFHEEVRERKPDVVEEKGSSVSMRHKESSAKMTE